MGEGVHVSIRSQSEGVGTVATDISMLFADRYYATAVCNRRRYTARFTVYLHFYLEKREIVD
jgi:hypothetical protein